jgi:hypothetical protein
LDATAGGGRGASGFLRYLWNADCGDHDEFYQETGGDELTHDGADHDASHQYASGEDADRDNPHYGAGHRATAEDAHHDDSRCNAHSDGLQAQTDHNTTHCDAHPARHASGRTSTTADSRQSRSSPNRWR